MYAGWQPVVRKIQIPEFGLNRNPLNNAALKRVVLTHIFSKSTRFNGGQRYPFFQFDLLQVDAILPGLH
jgi:hypothetical protein